VRVRSSATIASARGIELEGRDARIEPRRVLLGSVERLVLGERRDE